jgi:predicted HAD superfamily Cof-like phosphohydrolase
MWMTPYFNALMDFERAVGLKLDQPPSIFLPFEPGGAQAKKRARLIEEEAAELVAALMNEDIAGVTKECADLHYVTFGTEVTFGIPAFDAFLAVHENNMGKLGSATWDGQKLIKAKGYPKVDLTAILAKAGL